MDNNFEQQFTQSVQQAAAAQPTVKPAGTTTNPNSSTGFLSSRLPLFIIAGLGFIILLQVIALIIVLTNFAPETANEFDVDAEEATTTEENTDYIYSDSGLLTAFNGTCTLENGNGFTFSTDGKYSTTNGSQSGTYSITNGSLITLDGNNDHVFYYDEFNLADGLTLYGCTARTNTESAE